MNLDLTTQMIYDDNEIRVIWQKGSTDRLLITFGDLTTPANGHHYFGDTSARKAGIATLGIMAKRGNWYPNRSLHAAYEKILPIIRGYSIRMACGGGMGGYAALKFSRLFGATHVIALGPQWSIDLAECDGVNPGWQSYFHLGMRGMGIRADDVAGEVFLFSDSHDKLEVFHHRKMIEACPGLHHIDVPMVSNHVTSVLAETDDFVSLLNACVTANLTELYRLSRDARKNHYVWRTGIIAAALQRFPKIGYQALLKYARQDVAYFHPHKSYIYEILTDISKSGGIQEAVRFYDQCRALLDPVEQIKACAQLTRMGAASLRIETTHDTALVYDIKQNKCLHRQASADDLESYVKLEMFGQSAALYVVIGEVKMYLTSGFQTTICVPDGDHSQKNPFNFEIEPAPHGRFAIKFSGFYLCAEKAGAVYCNRPSANEWEQFVIGAYAEPTP
jgi:hypothetical protein